jgi:hypothetical protein
LKKKRPDGSCIRAFLFFIKTRNKYPSLYLVNPKK